MKSIGQDIDSGIWVKMIDWLIAAYPAASSAIAGIAGGCGGAGGAASAAAAVTALWIVIV